MFLLILSIKVIHCDRGQAYISVSIYSAKNMKGENNWRLRTILIREVTALSKHAVISKIQHYLKISIVTMIIARGD